MEDAQTAGPESGYEGYQPNDGYQQQQAGAQGNPNWDFLNSNFKSLVPPQYQDMVSRYNNFTDFLDSFHAQRELIGKKVSDFANSDWQTYANMVQQVSEIPADPSGYQLQKQEGSILDETDEAICREVACNLGLNNNQAQGLQQAIEEFGLAVRDSDAQQQADVEASLAQKWGNNFDYKLQAINRACTEVLPQLFGEPLENFAEELYPAVTHNSAVARLVAAVGELAMSAPTSGYGSVTTPQGAAATIEQLQSDPEFMNKYLNQTHPGHQQAKKTIQELLKLKNGEM